MCVCVVGVFMCVCDDKKGEVCAFVFSCRYVSQMRKREIGYVKSKNDLMALIYIYICVCVCEREREMQQGCGGKGLMHVPLFI